MFWALVRTFIIDATETYSDSFVELHLFFIILIGIKWIEANAMMEELCSNLKSSRSSPSAPNASSNATGCGTNLLFERLALLQGETVCLGNNRNDIDNFAEFFHDSHVYRTE